MIYVFSNIKHLPPIVPLTDLCKMVDALVTGMNIFVQCALYEATWCDTDRQWLNVLLVHYSAHQALKPITYCWAASKAGA